MAFKLKSRQNFIPGGFRFTQGETGWRSGSFQSFDRIVNNLIAHRRGRPDLVAKHGWATDYDNVANEVEQFNVRVCQQHGWNDYLEGGEAGGFLPPKSKAPSALEVEQVSVAAQKISKIWSGIKTLNDWIDSDTPPVAQALADSRALTCSKCVKNVAGDFSAWFTRPAADAIKGQIERLQKRKLATPYDDKINVCDVCLCPLKLKSHTPIEFIKAHMSEPVLQDLQKVPNCWVVAECYPPA